MIKPKSHWIIKLSIKIQKATWSLIFCIAFLLIFKHTSFATDYLAINSGNWSDDAIWQGGISPGLLIDNNDNISIASDIYVITNDGITFNNNATLTVDGNLEVNNYIIANNNLTIHVNNRLIINGYFEANNNYTTSISGSVLVTQDFIIKNEASIDVDGSLSIYGDFDGHNNNIVSGSGELNVQGSINGLNTDAYNGSINESYHKGTGLVNNGCYIKIGSNDVIYIKGNDNGSYYNYYKNSNDGTIDSDGKIIVEGDWKNYSTDNVFANLNNIGNVTFKGTALQQLGGSTKTVFENLTVDNSNGIIMDNDSHIFSVLDFQSGSINTDVENTLVVLSDAVGAISNEGIGKCVNGNIQRYMNTGTYSFPFASGTDYLPAALEITNLGSMSYLSAQFITSNTETVPENLLVNGTEITDFLDKGYWHFSPDNGTGVEYNITLTSRGHSNGGVSPEQHAILKREDDGEWESVGTHINTTQSGSESDPITATRSGLSNFSDFIIGKSEDNPLPVELLHFSANCTPGVVDVNWSTSAEINNDYFLLEYSYNGIDFLELAIIQGHGTSNDKHNYSYYHSTQASIIYYKLSQFDFDYRKTTFPIISAQCNKSNHENLKITTHNSDKITFVYTSYQQQQAKIILSDQLGRVLINENINFNSGENTETIYLPAIHTGAYIFQVLLNNRKLSRKIILY